SSISLSCLLLQCACLRSHLHSFPTRRSSDLVVRSDLSSVTPIVSAETAEQLSMDVTGMAVVWLSVADEDISQADLQEIVTNMVADTEVSSQDVSSPLVLRSMYQQAIDAVMLTVIGLLGISVLIA